MEATARAVDFFLGTTTPAGFKGYFAELCREDGRRMYLIKSGPGCGKSTLMKRLADRAGEPVERIHCSSDPDSLDGVVFCRQGAALVDATAPHVLEPEAPGAEETVISLYDTIDAAALRPHRESICTLFGRSRCLRQRAARYIASAGSLLLDNRRAAACNTDFSKVRAYAQHLAARMLPRREGRGSEQIRLLTGITPKGCLFYAASVPVLADRVVVFHDEHGAAARLILELLREQALARGHRIITCRCALHPDDKIDHLFVPELRLAFLTSNSWHTCRFPGQKNVHCSRFMDLSHLSCYRARLRFNRKSAQDFLEEAVALMAQAKACHDELEACYRPAVDFAAVDDAAARCAAALGIPWEAAARP